MPPNTDTPDVLAQLGAAPLALDPAAVRALGTPSALWGWDDEDDDAPGYDLVGDLAVISVRGALMQRGGWWWNGYDTLAEAFARALLDGRAASVVLAFDSPGGVVAGLFDAARRMRAAADAADKPVIAVSDERCYSAAYALACVADAIVVPETAGVGSVGVYGTLVSWAAALKAEGIDVRVIASGAQKAEGHPARAITDEAEAREQATVDALAAVFFAWVAERRPLTVAAVAALEGGLSMGRAAVAAKLADRVGTLAALLDGSLPIADCLPAPAEPAGTDDLPVPPPGEAASRGASRTTRNPMNLPTILAALSATDAAAAATAATALVTLRAQVHALTGATDDAAALGALHAMKRDAEAAAGLRAAAAADRKAAEAKDRATLLADAVAALKITPAEAALDGTPEGWTTALPTAGLRAFVARAGTVPPTPPRPPTGPAPGALTDDQKAIADQLGVDHAAYAKALAAQG